MDAAATLTAIHDIVVAAEEQGWDVVPDLKPVLDAGREAYAALQTVMADAFDEPEDAL